MGTQTLEQLLLETQFVSPTQLAIAQRDVQMRQSRLVPALLELGIVEERPFAAWMAQTTGIPIVHPLPESEIERLHRRVPRAIAREYEVLPVAFEDEVLTVAMVNPLDEGCLDVLRSTTSLKIRPVVALQSELKRLVARFYPEDDVEPTVFPGSATIAAVGSSTIVAARDQSQQESRLDRIEREMADLKKRIEAMEQMVSRVLPR